MNLHGGNWRRLQEDRAGKWELTHTAAHLSKVHLVLDQEAWGSEGTVEHRTVGVRVPQCSA